MNQISILGIFVADICFFSNSIPIRGQTILGTNHILYGNNILGNIDSLGSDSISMASYFYNSLPNFIPFDQWGSIGFPNLVSSSSIP